MKNISSATLVLFILNILALSAPAARAQTPQYNLDPAKGCVDYTVNVVTLVDNEHRMYWKQDDCIRVHVINNPFVHTYELKYGEQKIAEDDVIGSLGSLFGLKSINSTTAATPAKPSPTQTSGTEEVYAIDGGRQPVVKTYAAPKKCSVKQQQQEQKLLDSISRDATQLSLKVLAAEAALESLKGGSKALSDRLDAKENAYNVFQLDYLARRRVLLDSATDPDSLKEAAYSLQTDSLNLSKSLTGDFAFEGEIVDKFEAARLNNSNLRGLAIEASGLISKSEASDCILPKSQEELRSTLEKQMMALKERIDADARRTEVYTSQMANTACLYKARKEGEFSWVYAQVYQPVTAVLANPVAFGYSVSGSEGPFPDPTAVSVTLTRGIIVDKTGSSIPKEDNSVLECINDPSTILLSDNAFASFVDLPIPPPKQHLGLDKAPSSKPAQSTTTPKDATKPAATDNTVLVLPWFFGKARLVLTGGLTMSFLSKQEFQRSSSISGTTSSTVIGLKTDTRYRLSPMFYGHALLYSGRHDPDAFYATFGVTANSDSKGTSPEFLLGLSRSLAQQRFFLTLGAYIGEKQKLDGGLQVGQTIPTTLTGELPVTKSYHASWGFGISYRFTSTKDPQKDSSKQPSAKKP